MRFDKKITFVTQKDGNYNPYKGEYGAPIRIETIKRANVTDLGADRSVKLFGDILEGVKVIRLLRPFNKSWDYVKIDGFTYVISKKRDLRQKDTFIVKESVADEKT